MFVYAAFCLSVALLYVLLLLGYVRGWRRQPVWEVPPDFAPRTRVTVLIPARNEAANIAACLRSVLACDYPQHLLEIFVVDDFSDDDTACIVADMIAGNANRIRLEQCPPGFFGKKKALEFGVSQASGELIATTDADCIVPCDWLRLLVSLYEAQRPGAIAAPVVLHRERTLFQRFQALDLAGMMGITGAGIGMGWHIMGNGANLAYAKATFEAVGGYAGNADRASGDDLFLLGKIGAAGIAFLKNPAAVRTLPCPDARAFIRQRIRWGTKNAGMPDPGLKVALAIVFALCATLVLNTALLFFLPGLFWVCLGQWLLKAVADYFLLREVCLFFGRRDWLRSFWPAFFLHTAYLAGIGVASLMVREYDWKGRRVR